MILLLLCEITNAYFTNDFNAWLTKFYGSDVQATLNRWEGFIKFNKFFIYLKIKIVNLKIQIIFT